MIMAQSGFYVLEYGAKGSARLKRTDKPTPASPASPASPAPPASPVSSAAPAPDGAEAASEGRNVRQKTTHESETKPDKPRRSLVDCSGFDNAFPAISRVLADGGGLHIGKGCCEHKVYWAFLLNCEEDTVAWLTSPVDGDIDESFRNLERQAMTQNGGICTLKTYTFSFTEEFPKLAKYISGWGEDGRRRCWIEFGNQGPEYPLVCIFRGVKGGHEEILGSQITQTEDNCLHLALWAADQGIITAGPS